MFHKIYFFRSFFFLLFFFLLLFFFSFKFFVDFAKVVDEEYVIFFAISLVAFLLGTFAISSINSILNERISTIEVECKKNYDLLILNSNNLRNLYLKFSDFNKILINYFFKFFITNLNLFNNIGERIKLIFDFSFCFCYLKEAFLNFFFSLKKIFIYNINIAFSKWILLDKSIFRLFFGKRLRYLRYAKLIVKLRDKSLLKMQRANIYIGRFVHNYDMIILFEASKKDMRWFLKLLPTMMMRTKDIFFKKYNKKKIFTKT